MSGCHAVLPRFPPAPAAGYKSVAGPRPVRMDTARREGETAEERRDRRAAMKVRRAAAGRPGIQAAVVHGGLACCLPAAPPSEVPPSV